MASRSHAQRRSGSIGSSCRSRASSSKRASLWAATWRMPDGGARQPLRACCCMFVTPRSCALLLLPASRENEPKSAHTLNCAGPTAAGSQSLSAVCWQGGHPHALPPSWLSLSGGLRSVISSPTRLPNPARQPCGVNALCAPPLFAVECCLGFGLLHRDRAAMDVGKKLPAKEKDSALAYANMAGC